MCFRRIVLLALICLPAIAGFSQALGTWQEHLPFNSCIAVHAENDTIWAATPLAAFKYSLTDQTYQRLTRVQGLSATGVTRFALKNGRAVLAYENNQIDIVQGQRITPVNTLRLSSITANKQVNQIWMDENLCLLATGFGIAVLDLEKSEIGDVFLVANGGGYTNINALERWNGRYFAATATGLLSAPERGVNLADFRNWTYIDPIGTLQPQAVEKLRVWKGQLYAQQGNLIHVYASNGFQLWYEAAGALLSWDTTEQSMLITQLANNGAQLIELNTDAEPTLRFTAPLLQQPAQCIRYENSYWIADKENGLLQYTDGNLHQLVPNSPVGVGTGGLSAYNNTWLMADDSTLNQFQNGSWKTITPDPGSLPNFGKIGPVLQGPQQEVWIGSTAQGLAKHQQNTWQQFKENLLQASASGAYTVGGLAVDNRNQLWITNDGAANGLVVRKPDGTHLSFNIPFGYFNQRVTDIVIDDIDQKWIASPQGNGVFVFNHGTSVENTGDDRWRFFRFGAGSGNLPGSEVLSLTKDKFGFIWIGTNDGIGVIQCADQAITSANCEAVLPVVQSDNFAGFLFKGERVHAMVVDGANQKWIGTDNGLWLVSPDGSKTLQRFTTGNSPIPDNRIQKLALDHSSGTLLISTAKGLMSYQAAVTEGGTTNTNVLVYPNPVPPGYSGQIAIRGLVQNAFVKITELNGRLVFQGRAGGGQFIWNGHDLNGKRPASGVYLVWISDETRKEQAVAKIVFIQTRS